MTLQTVEASAVAVPPAPLSAQAQLAQDFEALDSCHREVLVTLIEAYEQKHYPIGSADPVEAIKFRMEQQNLTPKDLEPYIGSSGRVSEVLNRKRRLSLQMVRKLHAGLHIPYESLLAQA